MVEVQTAVGLEYTVCNRCAHYLEQEHGTTLAEQNETMQVLAQQRREKAEALGKSFAQAATQGAQLLGIAVWGNSHRRNRKRSSVGHRSR